MGEQGDSWLACVDGLTIPTTHTYIPSNTQRQRQQRTVSLGMLRGGSTASRVLTCVGVSDPGWGNSTLNMTKRRPLVKGDPCTGMPSPWITRMSSGLTTSPGLDSHLTTRPSRCVKVKQKPHSACSGGCWVVGGRGKVVWVEKSDHPPAIDRHRPLH